MPFLVDEVYQELLGIMQDAGFGDTFKGFFTQNTKTGNWDCTNVSGYTAFLAEIFAEDPDSYDYFLSWGGTEQIKSSQGGGIL